MEPIIFITSTFFSGVVMGVAHWRAYVYNSKVEEKKRLHDIEPSAPWAPVESAPYDLVREPIPASVREELDQTPGWWDKQFHKLLEASGTPRVIVAEGDEITTKDFAGRVCVTYKTDPQYYLAGCTCSQCHLHISA